MSPHVHSHSHFSSIAFLVPDHHKNFRLGFFRSLAPGSILLSRRINLLKRKRNRGVMAHHMGSQGRSCRVAVIGAGAAGLVAAHELQQEGHRVVVYEQSNCLGGVWAFSPEVEDDLLGLRPDRKRVHSSLYSSLRTNLPREIMGYLDFPFLPKKGRDERRYPGHEEVLLYLEDFAEHFGLRRLIRFGRRIERVTLCQSSTIHAKAPDGNDTRYCLVGLPNAGSEIVLTNGETENNGSIHHKKVLGFRWSIFSQSTRDSGQVDEDVLEEEIFDAVIVCNGHFSQPTIALIPGIERWPGKQLHSHNYRVPETFKEQVVVVIGNESSGQDIAREIAKVAKEVHWSGRTWKTHVDMSQPVGTLGNIWLHHKVDSAHEDGTVMFQEGMPLIADVILHCTGYSYSFPFLDTQSVVTVDDNRVGPLYQHVFPPSLAPSLSFVGLPWKVLPFPLFQLQSKWIAQSLSGKIHLPSREQMTTAVEEFYAGIEANGFPKHYTHNLSDSQFEYNGWLAKQCHCTSLEPWRMQIYLASAMSKRANPEGYRDTWFDHSLYEMAMADLGTTLN